MKIKLTLLTALLCLLCGIESAQAQGTVVKPKTDTSKIIVNSSTRIPKMPEPGKYQASVSGTVVFPKPVPAELQDVKCEDIKIYIGETKIETIQGGSVPIPNASVFHAYQQGYFLPGKVSSGKCKYEIDNPNEGGPIPQKSYEMKLDIPTGAAKGTCKGPFGLNYSNKTVLFPKEENEVINFKVEVVCGKLIG